MIRAEFVENAKRINADLIHGDFLKETNKSLQVKLQDSEDKSARLDCDLTASEQKNTNLAAEVETGKRKRQNLQLEVWAWRFLAALTLYGALK